MLEHFRASMYYAVINQNQPIKDCIHNFFGGTGGSGSWIINIFLTYSCFCGAHQDSKNYYCKDIVSNQHWKVKSDRKILKFQKELDLSN